MQSFEVQPKKPRAKRKKRTAQCPVCYESEPVKYGYDWKCRICETWVYDGGYGPDSYEIDEKYKAMIKEVCKEMIEKMRKEA